MTGLDVLINQNNGKDKRELKNEGTIFIMASFWTFLIRNLYSAKSGVIKKFLNGNAKLKRISRSLPIYRIIVSSKNLKL